MVKIIDINASYLNKSHLFECDQREFLEKAAAYFNFDVRDVDLYCVRQKGQLIKILPHEITDIMKIEILPKSLTMNGRQRTLRSCFENEPPIIKSADSIIRKLTDNSPLTGQERKTLVEWLSNSSPFSKKRKIDESTSKPVMHHRKVQVNFSTTVCKDSFAQTDFITVPEERERNQDEAVTDRIKKIAFSSGGNNEEAASLMRESFDDRRNFILLKSPPVLAVKHKYPSLFSLDEVKNELGRIFYSEKCDEFISNIHAYAPLIIQKCPSSHDLYIRTERQIQRAQTDVQKDYARAVGSIFILTMLMEEEWRFIHLQDYPHGSQDIYPHIDASFYSLKELYFDNHLYKIVVEGQVLCEATNLLEAILCLIAAFFIFNIDYPESCPRTLTAFEKLYLNANDTTELDTHTDQMVKLLRLEAKPRF